MANWLVCPMCKTNAVKPLDKTSDTQGYDCPNCGRFRVASSVFAEVEPEKVQPGLGGGAEQSEGSAARRVGTNDHDLRLLVRCAGVAKIGATRATHCVRLKL
jgi:hypothetical protein